MAEAVSNLDLKFVEAGILSGIMVSEIRRACHSFDWLRRGINIPSRFVEERFQNVAELAGSLVADISAWDIEEEDKEDAAFTLEKLHMIQRISMEAVENAMAYRRYNICVPVVVRPLFRLGFKLSDFLMHGKEF